MSTDAKPRPQRGAKAVSTATAVGAVVGLSILGRTVTSAARRRDRRPPDSAPGHTARRSRFGDFAVAGRSVTIDRPRDEVYAFWRNLANLPRFMEHVTRVEERGDITVWTISGPAQVPVTVKTRIVKDSPGEQIAWRSVEGSHVRTEGKVMLRDAPAGRGTVLTAIVAWVPPAGELGRALATIWHRDPASQMRRELKRLRMLLETGEIATAGRPG